MFIGLISILG